MATIKSDKNRLLVDFSWKGVRCREYLGFADTKEGRAQARQKRIQIEADLVTGTFQYAKWFPQSKRAKTIFAPPPAPAETRPPAFGTFAREFVERRKVLTTHAHYLDLKSLLETHLIPFFGEARQFEDSSFTIDAVEQFVVHMKSLQGLKGRQMSGVRVNKARALLHGGHLQWPSYFGAHLA